RANLRGGLAGQPVQERYLREAGDRQLVAWVLRDGLLVRGDGGRVVGTLDRIVGLLVERGQRLLDRLGIFGSAVIRGHDTRDAVLGSKLQQLVEDRAHLLVWHLALEERHGASRNDRGDRRNRSDPEGLLQ